MRKLSELIVLIRGGGEVGSAIAYRLTRSHFRVCIAEIASPSAISRGVSFSEAIYDTTKMVEELTAERTIPSLEQIYRVWRTGKIPIVADPELTVKPLIKPDVLINAMMLKRETNTKITDAPLVIGIGSGFTAGSDVHVVIESNFSNNLGNIIVEGESEKPAADPGPTKESIIFAEDTGVFTTEKNIGDSVLAEDIIGNLNDISLKAPISGVLYGILRNESKVLANAKLAEIDPIKDKSACFVIGDKMRVISGSVLEAIMMSLNMAEAS
jgi:xanthine dehydrogenase accessory factor